MGTIRVLLVDDNQPTRLLLRGCLERLEGVEVCGEAGDGVEALVQIWENGPDLLLLDLVMPRLGGTGLLRSLQADPPPRRPKIIVLTHMSCDDALQYAISLGADYYMLKPVNFAELCSVIFEVLFKRQTAPTQTVARALWILLRLGAPEGVQGLRYAALTAEALVQDPSGQMQLKVAYGAAEQEGSTNQSNVERSIRYLIGLIHRQGTEQYAAFMGGIPDRPPSNHAFLHRLAAALRQA